MAINITVFVVLTLPMSFQGVDPSSQLAQDFLRILTPELGFPVPMEQVLAGYSQWDLYVYLHGFKPGAASAANLLTSLFMHAGFAHLAGNMLFLWIYGDNVEHRLGRPLFLLTYLATGIVATLSFAAFSQGSMVPLIGASGAISGVLGCYFIFFPRNRVKVFVFFFPFIMTTVMVPARLVLGVFLVIDNLLPALFTSSSGGGVAYGAHIGGFVGGLALAFAVNRLGWDPAAWPKKRTSKDRPRPSKKAVVTLAQSEGALKAALRTGDRPAAIRQARNLHPSLILQQLGPETVTLAQWLADGGESILAMSLLRRALSLNRKDIDQARVSLTLGLVRLSQGQSTAAYQHLLAVFDHDPDERTEARARSALTSIAKH